MPIQLKTTLLWIIKIGLFIVPFVPLYISSSLFFPFITGKAFVFRTIVEIVFVAWIALMLFYSEFRPRKTPLLYALLIFIAIVILAAIFGANPYRSFWSNFERMEGLITHLHLLAYFLIMAHVFQKKDWLIFFNLFVISSLGQNIYVLLQKFGVFASPQGGFRTDGTIGNATYVASYSLFALAITILLWFGTQKKWARYWYAFMTLFTLLTIYFTAARGPILALAIGFIIAAALYLVLAKPVGAWAKLYRRLVIAGLIVLILSGIALKAFQNSEFVKSSEILSRIASISLSEGKPRFIIWNMGLQGFMERPILGWGPENYNLIFAKYFDPRLFSQEPWFDRSHNIVLDWLTTAGILGFLAYVSILITSIFLVWKNYRLAKSKNLSHWPAYLKTAALISILFLVYFLENLFVFDQLTTYLSFFAILAYIQSTQIPASGEKQGFADAAGKVKPNSNLFKIGVAVLAFIILIPVFYQVNYKPLAVNLTLIEAMQFGSAGELDKSFDGFNAALAYNTFGHTEISEQLGQFAISVLGFERVGADFKQKVYERAISALKENIKVNPNDPRAYIFLGAVYRSGGLLDDSADAFREAIRLSPTKQQTYFELGDTYIRRGDHSEAVRVLKAAFQLEPNFVEARMNLVAAHILNDEQDKADKLLIEGFGRVDISQPILTQVYLIKKNYQRLIDVWSAFVEHDPKKTDYHKNLAATYLAAGKITEAIRVLEKAIEINPGFKEEGERHIREIKAGGRS